VGSTTRATTFGLIALAAALLVVVIVFVAGSDDEETSAPSGKAATAAGQADPEAVALFTDTCGQCHTLTVAGTEGDVGPNLDDEAYDTERVRNAIENGAGNGQMAPGLLEGADADAVASLIGTDDPALAAPDAPGGGSGAG
jgi:mono/diheme cytochrome c family protein